MNELIKREYFALHILTGIISSPMYEKLPPKDWDGTTRVDWAIRFSIGCADELIKKLNEEPKL